MSSRDGMVGKTTSKPKLQHPVASFNKDPIWGPATIKVDFCTR